MQENKSAKPPQSSLLLRILGGAYLLYLAWDLFHSGDVKIMVAAVVFGIVGAALIGTSLYILAKSDYFYDKPAKTEEPMDEE